MPVLRSGATDTFRDLALAMTPEERRELLRKISGSLSLNSGEDQPLYKQEVAEAERHALIGAEIEKLSLLGRIRFFLRRIFSTKPHDQAFIDFRLHELRRRIRVGCPAMAPLEHHSVCAEVATATWALYQAVYPLIPMFLDLWRSGSYLQESIEYLLSKRIPAARSNLPDFASVEELQDAFMENELKGDVRKLVVERLGIYLDEIPDDLFAHLEEGVLPLYFLRPLCLLDYNRLFAAFGFDPGITPPDALPPFNVAPTSAALPLVEGLLYGLHSAARLEHGFYVHMDILDRYLELKEIHNSEEEGEVSEGDASEAEEDASQQRRVHLQELRDQLETLHAAATRLGDHIAFSDVVRYYRRDPWHRMVAYMPKLRLREFYQSYLMMRVLSQLDESFGDVRVGVISRMIEELFGGAPSPFEYYRPAILSAPDKLGLPKFRHIRSATVLQNFLRHIYRTRLQEIVRTLSRVLPVRQRDSSSALVVHVAGIEQALADLDGFDRSFSPDSDDGKAFFRVRYGVEKDVTLHRSYRNIVQHKDREVRSMIDLALEHLRGLLRAFENMQRTLSDQLRQRYAEADASVSTLDGLDGLLEEYSGKLGLLDKLVKQILAMEEGY
ncbi:MAG: hypothetical protein V3S41_05785 [Spirochaetia bacterium]